MSVTIDRSQLLITCDPNLNAPQILLVNFHFYIVNVLSASTIMKSVISFKISLR